MSYTADKRIDNFIGLVTAQVHTEEEATRIQEELRDHIQCLIEDYIEQDCTEAQAVGKALRQMGDPGEIGYSFTDHDLMKRRHMLLWLFKALSALCVVFLCLTSIYEGGRYVLENLRGPIVPLTLVYTSMTMGNAGYQMADRSTRIFDIDSKPLLVIWPVKHRIHWEYIIAVLFFAPIAVVLGIALVYEGVTAGEALRMLFTALALIGAIGTYVYAERFRIPKYIVMEDGLVIKGRLMPWAAVLTARVQRDYMTKNNWKLLLEDGSDMPITTTIPLRDSQKNMVAGLIAKKV